MHSRIALWTPFRDAGPRLYLEVYVDIDLAVLLTGILNHASQGLFIVGLAPAAHVVHGGLAAQSATARAVDKKCGVNTPEYLLDVDRCGVDANEESYVEING